MLTETTPVLGTVNYLQWRDDYLTEKPFLILYDLPKSVPDQRTSNLSFVPYTKLLHDAREGKSRFEIDKHGFMYRDQRTMVTKFNDRDYVDKQYLPEVENLLRSELDGVDRIYFFDWRVRASNAKDADGGGEGAAEDIGHDIGKIFDLNDYTALLHPSPYAHVDQSPSAVVSRIKLQLAEDADRLLRGRVRVVNVWRPLVNPVEDNALAVCDGRTVTEAELMEADHVRRNYVGATIYCLNSEAHKWYYLSNQSPDEVLIMKMFDSQEDKTKYCPHSAIKVPGARPDAPARKSIEVRALVFTYPENIR